MTSLPHKNRFAQSMVAFSAVAVMTTPLHAETAWELANRYAGQAIKAYPALQVERQNVAIAETKEHQALGALMPSVDVGSRYTSSMGGREIRFDINDLLPASVIPVDVPPTVIPFLRAHEQETKVTVTQPLFTGGGLYRSWKSARKSETATREMFKGTVNSLAYSIRKASFDAFAAQEVVELRTVQLAQAREQLRTVQSKYETQVVSASEVKRAEASLAEAEADSIAASGNALLAAAVVNRYLGKPFDSPLDTPEASTTLPPLSITLDEAKQRAMSSRPELKSIASSIGAAKEGAAASRSGYLPNVVFAGEYGFQGEEYAFNKDSEYGRASLVMSWNMFEGRRTSAKIQQAKLVQKQLNYKQQEARDGILLDVTSAWLTATSRNREWQAARRGVIAATEGYRMTQQLFEAGMASQLQLLDARAALTGAGTAEIVARYSFLTALADLERSTGTALEGEDQ